MSEPQYLGVVFPDRAEAMKDTARFGAYRVFLDHWNPLAGRLRTFYEGLALRGETRAVILLGAQGSGKTLFATKLVDDLSSARSGGSHGTAENLWHRMTGGSHLSKDLIDKATQNTELLHIEDDRAWINRAQEWRKNNPSRHCIIVADNAERSYFIQGLVELSDAQFIAEGFSEPLVTLAAQRFVAQCRGSLRGCLFLILTNNELFALLFEDAVRAQHDGLATLEPLRVPSHQDKEAVIRINVNRLNPMSYWYCLDKAGPEAKVRVYNAIIGQDTFPGCFRAVDEAIKGAAAARVGRPARKGTLSLLVLTDKSAFAESDFRNFGEEEEPAILENWVAVKSFRDGWAQAILSDERRARLVESEWNLRVVMLGDPFVASLLERQGHVAQLQRLFDLLRVVHGPGTHQATRDAWLADLRDTIQKWTPSTGSTSAFWAKGQARCSDYESALKEILAGGYNLGAPGFLSYRPDHVIADYVPCSVMRAASDAVESIKAAIRRDAHVFELTAIKDSTAAKAQSYLSGKLPNYAAVLEDQ